MSFKKVTIDNAKLIQFFYPLDDIWAEASEITAFKASGIRRADGQAEFDRVHISKDEKTHLKKYVHKAMLEIFGIMFKVLGEQPIFHDADTTTTPAVEAVTADPDANPPVVGVEAVAAVVQKCSGAYLDDNETGYRSANLSLIDSKISDAVVDSVLQRWYWLKNLGDDSAMHAARFAKLLVDIQDLTLSLRKPY
jgi:hypothetical protein